MSWMVFYVIEPVSQPEILFACSIVTELDESSRNILDHREGVIELSYSENLKGGMHIQTEYGEYEQPEGVIGLFMPDCRYMCQPLSVTPKVSMTSVAVRFSQLHFTRYEMQDLQEIWFIMQRYPTSLILPQLFVQSSRAATGDETRLIQTKMCFLISTYKDKSASGRYSCIAQWYDLCAEIDSHFRAMIRDQVETPENRTHVSSAYYYIYKARKYIGLHLGENIKAEDVSRYVGLAHPYFVRLFKKETGISLNNYIAQQRISHLRIVLDRHDTMSFKELSAACGFTDIRHVQRLFLKHTGVSMQEYRKQGHGLTLYHTNPWNYKDLDEDLLKKDQL